jgi:hypothetical protein
MCVVDLGHCDCSCHYMEGVAHMMPCCYVCPECGKRSAWPEHQCLYCHSHMCEGCLEKHEDSCEARGEAAING